MAEALTLYVIHGSHPCMSVEAGLRVKGLEYRTAYLQFGLSQFTQAVRFLKHVVAPHVGLVHGRPQLRVGGHQRRTGRETVLHQVRWIAVDAIRREPSVALAYGSKSAPPLPASAIPGATKALFTTEMKLLGQSPERVRDEYVPAQMAGSIRLLQTFEDLRDVIDSRPCGKLARRLVPDYDGSMPRGVIDSPL